MKKSFFFLAASGLLIFTLALKPFSERPSANIEPDIHKLMEIAYLWELLDADYEPNRQRDDTWLEVGFRSKYAMAKKYASLQMIESAFGVPVFVKGPHTNGMDFNSNNSFGHYNPEFIAKVSTTFDNAMRNPLFRRAARRVYKQYFASMANTYRDSYLYLDGKPDYLAKLQEEYKTMMANDGTGDGAFTTEFSDFANKLGKEKNADIYEAVTAPAFWLRRSIDGTGPEMYKLLDKMINRMERKNNKKNKKEKAIKKSSN